MRTMYGLSSYSPGNLGSRRPGNLGSRRPGNLGSRRFNNVPIKQAGSCYEQEIFEQLVNTYDYRKFERLIAWELEKIRLQDWAWLRIDMPLQLAADDMLGTMSREHIELYQTEQYYDCDFILQHCQDSCQAIFKFDVDAHVQAAPIITEEIRRYKALSEMHNRFGWPDAYFIPVVSDNGDGRSVFSVSSNRMPDADGKAFKKLIKQNDEKLKSIARAVFAAGTEKFPDKYIDGKKVFDKLVRSQPFNLLVTMVRFDLTLNQAAERLDISVNTAQKHILNIRRALGAKTNYGAYEAALRRGLILPS